VLHCSRQTLYDIYARAPNKFKICHPCKCIFSWSCCSISLANAPCCIVSIDLCYYNGIVCHNLYHNELHVTWCYNITNQFSLRSKMLKMLPVSCPCSSRPECCCQSKVCKHQSKLQHADSSISSTLKSRKIDTNVMCHNVLLQKDLQGKPYQWKVKCCHGTDRCLARPVEKANCRGLAW
jgi:hypothetical protein